MCEKSTMGRGGKIESLPNPIARTTSRFKYFIGNDVMNRGNRDTLFVLHLDQVDTNSGNSSDATSAYYVAYASRSTSRSLQRISLAQRSAVLKRVAVQLGSQGDAWQHDLAASEVGAVDEGPITRLKLIKANLQILAHGITAIVPPTCPSHAYKCNELVSGLVLRHEAAPIDGLFVFFVRR